MVIAIIALAVLLIISVLINLALGDLATDLFLENLSENPKEYFKYYLKLYSKEIIECTLLIVFLDNDDFTGTAYDFSTYESNGVIGMYCYLEGREDEDVEKHLILPNQKVHLMKDGSYQWDLTNFI